MPLPFLESPYPPPDETMYGHGELGAVGPISGPSAVGSVPEGSLLSAARAYRYWAAMSAVVGAPYGLALQMNALKARRERPPEPEIPQTDTLELHRPAPPPENPFENLVSHRRSGPSPWT